MGKLPSIPTLAGLGTIDELKRYTSIAVTDIQSLVDGNIEFDKNIKSQTVDVSFGTANTDVRVAHTLGRVPTGYIVVSMSAAASIYQGSQAWDAAAIFLRSNVQCQAKVILI